MRVALIEDEAPARRQIVRLLAALRPEARVSAELDSVESARAYFAVDQPDLVLSDIRLGDGSALCLFEEGMVAAPVIFITAYDTWLEQALGYLSVDYLQKPIDRAALARALDKVDQLARHFTREQAREVAALVTRRPRERVLCRYRNETRILSTTEIAYFRADDKLTLGVDRAGREYVVERTLNQLEAELDAARFFRASRGALVQIDAIQGFRSAGRGRLALSLVPAPKGDVLVSQENAAAFRAFVDR